MFDTLHRTTQLFAAAFVICIGSSLAACVPATEEANDPTSESAPVEPTRTPTKAPTTTPVAPRTIGFTCTYEAPREHDWDAPAYEDRYFGSMQEVWAAGEPAEWCEMKVATSGPISTTEIEATKVAGYDSVDDVRILWEICASLDDLYMTNGALNEAQQAEANGALMLCPDHPGAQIMANGSREQNEREAGVRFGDGVREVGKAIQPGVYRAAGDIKNCYWERLDSSGGTIDNEFILAATQVEVTVDGSDFSLHTRGCGEFVKVG